jgi:hypothetical protein
MVVSASAPRMACNLPACRERLGITAMNRLVSAALALLAVAAWSSEGWSRTTRHGCDVNGWASERLENWKRQLARSMPEDPTPIVGTYDFRRGPAADLRERAAHEPVEARNHHRLFQGLPQGQARCRVRQANRWRGLRERFRVGALQLQTERRQRPDVTSPLYLCLSGARCGGSDHAAPLLAGAKNAGPAVRGPSGLTARQTARGMARGETIPGPSEG